MVLSHSVLSGSLWPHECSPSGSSVHGDSPGKSTGVGSHSLLQGSSHPGIEPRSPTLQADSLPEELPGKPRNTGVGSLSLVQGIFMTQEWGLLNYRQILYQPSYQGSSKPATHTHISPLFWISFPYRSPQSTEQSPPCSTVSSWLVICFTVCVR